MLNKPRLNFLFSNIERTPFEPEMSATKPKKVKLQVVKTSAEYDPERVLGKEMFRELYSNIYIAGKKKSGKTMLLYNILKRCANKSTKVLLFSPTVEKDPTYKEIEIMLKRKGIDYSGFDHFIDPEDGSDLIAQFIRQAKEDAAAENREEPVVPPTSRKYVPKEEARLLFGDELPRAEIAKKEAADAAKAAEEAAKAAEKALAKSKKGRGRLAPEYILVFDDLGVDLRKKSISQLLIKNRHYRCKTIILSQWLSYLPPTAIRQLDYALLFGGFPEDKLEDLHQKLDLSNTVEEFKDLYHNATAKKYHFLSIDIAEQSYRTNFDS